MTDLIYSILRVKFSSHSRMHAYSINAEKQNKLLVKVYLLKSFVKDMRVGKKNNLLPSQKGILISNESLKNLHNDIKMIVRKYSISCDIHIQVAHEALKRL